MIYGVERNQINTQYYNTGIYGSLLDVIFPVLVCLFTYGFAFFFQRWAANETVALDCFRLLRIAVRQVLIRCITRRSNSAAHPVSPAVNLRLFCLGFRFSLLYFSDFRTFLTFLTSVFTSLTHRSTVYPVRLLAACRGGKQSLMGINRRLDWIIGKFTCRSTGRY